MTQLYNHIIENYDATASNVNFTSIGALFSFFPEVNSRLVEHVGATVARI